MTAAERRISAGSAAVLLAGLTACGSASHGGSPSHATEANPAGDIPDSQVYVRYHPPQGQFLLSVPEGWSRSTAGRAVVFTDKLNTVRIETRPAATAPTIASVKTHELPVIRSASRGFRSSSVNGVTRNAGQVILIKYRTRASSDPVTGKPVIDAVERYEFWRHGHEAILTLSGPQSADNVDPWRKITDSLRWA